MAIRTPVRRRGRRRRARRPGRGRGSHRGRTRPWSTPAALARSATSVPTSWRPSTVAGAAGAAGRPRAVEAAARVRPVASSMTWAMMCCSSGTRPGGAARRCPGPSCGRGGGAGAGRSRFCCGGMSLMVVLYLLRRPCRPCGRRARRRSGRPCPCRARACGCADVGGDLADRSLSMPRTTMRVGAGTSKVMPSGASTSTGWLKPSARSSVSGPGRWRGSRRRRSRAPWRTVGDADDHVVDQRAGQAVQGPALALVVGPLDERACRRPGGW